MYLPDGLTYLFLLSVQASVTSSTAMTKSKTVIKMEKEKIYLYLNQFKSKVIVQAYF